MYMFKVGTMHYAYTLQAAKSWQTPQAATRCGFYCGAWMRALLCFSLVPIVALFGELQGAAGSEERETHLLGEEEHPAPKERETHLLDEEERPASEEQETHLLGEEEHPAPEERETHLLGEEEHPATENGEAFAADSRGVEGEATGGEQLQTDKGDVKDDSAGRDISPEGNSDHGTGPAPYTNKLQELRTKIKDWWGRHMRPGSYKCQDVRRAGGVPSVREGHAPIETFGYPVFDEKSGRLFLEPRVPLSVVNGYMQPIKVGATDYIIRGSLAEIVAFLDCFRDYEVIASAVDADGHWVSAPGHSNVVLQLQNSSPDLLSPLEVDGRILDLLMSAFSKVTDRLRGTARTPLAEHVNTFIENVRKIQSIEQLQGIPQLFNVLLECNSVEQVVAAIGLYIKHAAGQSGLKEGNGWADREAVNLTRPLTLKISSYPQPGHGVRATLVMPVNRTTLSEIRQTLPDVFSVPRQDRETVV